MQPDLSQRDLFQPHLLDLPKPVPKPVGVRDVPTVCGRCVHWNGMSEDPEAPCCIHGARGRLQPVCDSGHAFGMSQLLKAPYGKDRVNV